jgi:hypothetical protein
MTTHLLSRRIYNIDNRNMSLELYSKCNIVLQNFRIFFRSSPKLPKFRRNFTEILNPPHQRRCDPAIKGPAEGYGRRGWHVKGFPSTMYMQSNAASSPHAGNLWWVVNRSSSRFSPREQRSRTKPTSWLHDSFQFYSTHVEKGDSTCSQVTIKICNTLKFWKEEK